MRIFWLCLGLAAVPLSAEAPAPYGHGRQVHFDEAENKAQKRIDFLNKKVALAPDQLHRATEALVDEDRKLEQLTSDYQEARKRILEEADGTLLGILNPEQQTKYQKLKADVIGKADSPPPP